MLNTTPLPYNTAWDAGTSSRTVKHPLQRSE
jgi:hypothetical protein